MGVILYSGLAVWISFHTVVSLQSCSTISSLEEVELVTARDELIFWGGADYQKYSSLAAYNTRVRASS